VNVNKVEGIKFQQLQTVQPGQAVRSEMASKTTAKTVLSSLKTMQGATTSSLWSMIDGRVMMHKPHKAHDPKYGLIQALVQKYGAVMPSHFQAIRSLGQGDVGNVQLVEIRDGLLDQYGADRQFAIKRMNKQAMVDRNKVHRVKVEQEILSNVDHPFLPTMYASFQTEKHLHFVMELCTGGELYRLLLRQPNKRFSEPDAMFYAAEVLLAMQYLHTLGYLYRDLKPENVLLSDSGHVVLTDFDLSYVGATKPTLMKVNSKKGLGLDVRGTIMVAEPEARANSFVGTEEYLSPEVVSSLGHDGNVDWWSLGVFIYELVYGVTPFKGNRRDATFHNVLHQKLWFPETPKVSKEFKDLCTGLLTKDVTKRFARYGGAEEVKQHPFFRSINWALIRDQKPPFSPAVERALVAQTTALGELNDETLDQ